MDLDALQQGIYAARQGRRAEARAWLREALRRNPNSEQAWLWLSTVVETESEYQMCLERALAINPLNETTRARLQDVLRSSRRSATGRRPLIPPYPQKISPSKKTISKMEIPSASSPEIVTRAPALKPHQPVHSVAPQIATSLAAHGVASKLNAERASSTIPLPALTVMGCLTITAISGLLVLISLLLMGWAS
ncbi:MAG: tetratricopeptide repeat protein [Anaerolineae bacterium]